MKRTPWVGVDLDGTWVVHHGAVDFLNVGEPVPAITRQVKRYLKFGIEVRVFTARVGPPPPGVHLSRPPVEVIRSAIQDWTEAIVGQRLKVTNEKDFDMVLLLDDRAVRIVANTGLPCCEAGKAALKLF